VPNFESFSRRMVPLQAVPHVTVQKRGTLSLNRSAFEALGAPDAVKLLYDRDARIIGLRAVPAADPDASLVRASSRGRGPWVVSAMAFTKFYGIDTSTTVRRQAYLEDDVLCVDLRLEGVPGTGDRASTPDGP
jgi:hypothetical protein